MTEAAEPPLCLATGVTADALKMIEDAGGDGGIYRSSHPWIVASERFREVASADGTATLLFYDLDNACFARWTTIRDIDVVEFHRGRWETQVRFAALQPVPEIWAALDSIMLQPSREQLERERREPVGTSRTPCSRHELSSYAVCEAPVFVLAPG